METEHFIKKIDNNGRVTLPAECRKAIHMELKEFVEVNRKEDQVELTKVTDECIFCTKTEELDSFMGKPICPECKEKIAKLREMHPSERPDDF